MSGDGGGGGGGGGDMIKSSNKGSTKRFQKSYFDVLGLCCSSEVGLIERILKPMEGVKDVSVIIPSKTLIVLHDHLLVSQLQIVNALNQARLEANVRVYGDAKYQKKWPSPYAVACGVLLLLSFLKYVFRPLQWLALGAVAIGIVPIFLRGVAALRNWTLDSNILALIAVIGSIALRDYWEAGSIVFLFTIAQWLESRASHKATAVMSSLMNLVPQKAVLAETGQEVDADAVKVDTLIAVKAGEIIPIDGIVVEGKCDVDEKTLTGESFPVSKQNDSTVWAGTINLNGYISIRTTALAEDCVVARMAKLVEDAQNNKSKTQKFIDKCAKYYTPAVVIISGGVALVPLIFRLHKKSEWFHLALVVLVSACPCALILSTPVATFCALSKAATSGLLIKGGEYLETLSKVKTMAFDKTGTITRGEFVVTDFQSLSDGVSLNTLLYWVSSIESKSSHPMAAALIDYGRSHYIEPRSEHVEEFDNFPGEGIHGKIDGKDVYVGNRKIGQRAGCETVPSLEGYSNEGKSIGYIFLGAAPAGVFSLSDTCRTGVKEAINELKSMGIRTAMLTGDSREAAILAQDQLEGALDIVESELLPEDKARIITDFQRDGPTAMVGDGLNDAPALATADIGISMGISGSALAKETGHVILMSNDMRKIPKSIQLARQTHWKVMQNVFFSISTKAAILGLAFAGHPLVWAAVLADVGTCLVVIFNSMLLLKGTGERVKRYHKKNLISADNCGTCCGNEDHPHGSKQSLGSNEINQNCCSGPSACKEKECTSIVQSHKICVAAGDGAKCCEEPKKKCHLNLGSSSEITQSTTSTDGHCHLIHRIQNQVHDHDHDHDHDQHHHQVHDQHHHQHHQVHDHHIVDEQPCNVDETGCLSTTREAHSECENHAADHNCPPLDSTMDVSSASSNHMGCAATKACQSLKKRHIGGCSKSVRKECCGKSGGNFGASFRGGLSEIVIE